MSTLKSFKTNVVLPHGIISRVCRQAGISVSEFHAQYDSYVQIVKKPEKELKSKARVEVGCLVEMSTNYGKIICFVNKIDEYRGTAEVFQPRVIFSNVNNSLKRRLGHWKINVDIPIRKLRVVDNPNPQSTFAEVSKKFSERANVESL